MPDDRASDWFLSDHNGEHGPFTEAEMRRRIRRSSRSDLKVRQGDSQWHSANEVRRKIAALTSHGVYVRYLGTAEGPFTLTRAHSLIESIKMDGIEVRTGSEGEWIPASQWLKKIRELQKRGNRDVESCVAEVNEEEEEIPVATLIKPAPSFSSIVGSSDSAMPHASRGTQPLPAHNARYLKPWPRNPGKKTGRSPYLIIATLSLATLSAAALLVFVIIGRSADEPGATSVAARGGTTTTSDSEPMLRGSVLSRITGEMATSTASRQRGSVAPSQPPPLGEGTLFRPKFTVNSEIVDAGTAFAANVEGSSRTLILSALHLLGPAGGLDVQLASDELPQAWTGLELEDCCSRNWFGTVTIRPLLLKGAQPLPESSVFGDVVACVVDDGSGFQTLPLASRQPVVGERVWLVSRVIGSVSTQHAARIHGVEDGSLLYEYEQPHMELRATSGAPVVNSWGEVVAVNAGGREQEGTTIGVGTPVSKFLSAIQHQLEQ